MVSKVYNIVILSFNFENCLVKLKKKFPIFFAFKKSYVFVIFVL